MSDAPLVRLLGTVAVRNPSDDYVTPARLDGVVLAHLALAKGRSVPAADLIEAVWGLQPPGARNALQVKISRLRRILGEYGDRVRHQHGSYLLDVPPTSVDVHLFADLAASASEALTAGRPLGALAAAERADALWHGAPLPDLDEHPRLVATRIRLVEQRATLGEVTAEALLASERGPAAVDVLRDVLAGDPLRPRARLLLMRALDRSGRRTEALAVYDAGRRALAEETGLAPPVELQDEFERLLAAERAAALRERAYVRPVGAPPGAADAARWLVREGAEEAALELALRGAWWWWLGGRRSQGRELLEEILGTSSSTEGEVPGRLAATAWMAVFDAVSATAAEAIASGEAALTTALDAGWGRHESVAALLLAERLFQRGEPGRDSVLLRASNAWFLHRADRWGLALVALTQARAALQRGDVRGATDGGRTALQMFADLDDAAGQTMAMDLLGYCAEVRGDLATAATTHQRALTLAREVDAAAWQATELTRLGSVQALLSDHASAATLTAASHLARSIGSEAGVALADNALGLARGLSGDHDAAADIHRRTLVWYEQQDSPAGVSYTAGRLAHERAHDDPTAAAELAARSLALAEQTGDPRAVAHGLEAIALTHEDAPTRARALGGARTLRRRTGSPLPPVIADALRAAERDLADRLGDDLPRLLREGAGQGTTLNRTVSG